MGFSEYGERRSVTRMRMCVIVTCCWSEEAKVDG